MFLKNRNIIFKMKISKVTDYAALRAITGNTSDIELFLILSILFVLCIHLTKAYLKTEFIRICKWSELYQNTVSQYAKRKICSKYHSLIYQGLELLLNSICRGLHTCNLSILRIEMYIIFVRFDSLRPRLLVKKISVMSGRVFIG